MNGVNPMHTAARSNGYTDSQFASLGALGISSTHREHFWNLRTSEVQLGEQSELG
jgi:hypothetical protein